MVLFLLALGMLFAASMLAYAIIRYAGAHTPPVGYLALPWLFWISTAVILCSGVSMHYARRSIMADRQAAFRRGMTMTTLLGFAFLAVQTPAMIQLIGLHNRSVAERNIYLFGLVLLLIALHAAHVVGGIIALCVTTYRAHTGRYDAEHCSGVRHCAMYWHFLDAVWIVMFTVFSITA